MQNKKEITDFTPEREERLIELEKKIALLLWLHGGKKPETGKQESPDRHFDYVRHNPENLSKPKEKAELKQPLEDQPKKQIRRIPKGQEVTGINLGNGRELILKERLCKHEPG